MMGLADDGGLLVPTEFPDVRSMLPEWRSLDFTALRPSITAVISILLFVVLTSPPDNF